LAARPPWCGSRSSGRSRGRGRSSPRAAPRSSGSRRGGSQAHSRAMQLVRPHSSHTLPIRRPGRAPRAAKHRPLGGPLRPALHTPLAPSPWPLTWPGCSRAWPSCRARQQSESGLIHSSSSSSSSVHRHGTRRAGSGRRGTLHRRQCSKLLRLRSVPPKLTRPLAATLVSSSRRSPASPTHRQPLQGSLALRSKRWAPAPAQQHKGRLGVAPGGSCPPRRVSCCRNKPISRGSSSRGTPQQPSTRQAAQQERRTTHSLHRRHAQRLGGAQRQLPTMQRQVTRRHSPGLAMARLRARASRGRGGARKLPRP
jgi:hypothetical protein